MSYKKKSYFYMSFNIKQHIYTSVISWWLAAARLQLQTLASGVGKTNFTLDISAAAASEEAAASRPCLCWYPARYSPVLATAVSGACICVCAWCSKALHLLLCVQGIMAALRVRQCSQHDVHGVHLRAHDADVLVYDISVSTRCGNFRVLAQLVRARDCQSLGRRFDSV